ncbi:MAG: hypothetical protein JEZ12_24445 [Desulfobacterium sp.]|nr:hypothetical protein [Desulfobacterium sp.]
MSKKKCIYFLYQKDFSEKGKDRYFVYEDGLFSEVDSDYIINLEADLVTHDYWLIGSSLYKKHKRLPNSVIDINLLSRIVAGVKAVSGDTQSWDIPHRIKPLYRDQDDFNRYMSMYYRREELSKDAYMLFAHKLEEYKEQLFGLAEKAGELYRFFDIELPLFNLFSNIAAKGLRISEDVLKKHKLTIKYDYYKGLKEFAEKHDVLYEQPSDGDVKDKLRLLGYDVDNYGIDFLIDFLPSTSGFTEDLRRLQKLGKSYRVFNSISSGAKRLNPIVETHATSTSRIYFKSPNIQNISKRYRDIFIPDDGLQLSYIDYDQFEVGIMAALSADEKMNDIYTNMDAYLDLSTKVFGSGEFRKK